MSVTLDYTLHLADNALVLGQRNAEWTGHGPILEEDIAMSNITLDMIGQARLLYQYAAQLEAVILRKIRWLTCVMALSFGITPCLNYHTTVRWWAMLKASWILRRR